MTGPLLDPAGEAGTGAGETLSVGTSPASSPLQAWIAEFLRARGLKAPNAQPLHRYQAGAGELARLTELLRETRDHASGEVPLRTPWAAAYSLALAEAHRRDYGGSGEPPAWVALEQALGEPLPDDDRIGLIDTGLAHWKRPRPLRDGAPDLPEVLTGEAGLPWKLLQTHEAALHGAIRHALRSFPLTATCGRTTSGRLAEEAAGLPGLFQDLGPRQLLAGVVEQLMSLVTQHPLSAQADPAAYLDEHAPGWQAVFPLPPEDTHARELLSGWLKEAAEQQGQQKNAPPVPRVLACRHRLLGGAAPGWRLAAELSLPAEETIPLDLRTLSSTRLVAAVFEGERLLQLAGSPTVLAMEEGLKVQYPPLTVTVERQGLREPLSLRLLEGGRCIHAAPIGGSQLDLDGQPLVFEKRDGEEWLAANASVSLAAPRALIRVPPTAQVKSSSAVFTEEDGACWIEAEASVTVRKDGETYRIGVDSSRPMPGSPVLQGPRFPSDTAVFLGWPRLELSAGSPHALEDLQILVDGEPAPAEPPLPGAFQYSVRTAKGDTLFTQCIRVLPPGLSVVPSAGDPAQLVVTGAPAGLHWRLAGEGVSGSGTATQETFEIPVAHRGQAPAWLSLELAADAGFSGAVTLSFVYPSAGARLIDRAGRDSKVRDLALDDLRGARIVLVPGTASGQQEFHLQLDLLSSGAAGLRHHHVIRVSDAPLCLWLGGHLGQIQQMLGAVDDPDAYVRLAVETDHPLLQINIRRFGSLLESTGPDKYRVVDIDGRTVRAAAEVDALAPRGTTGVRLAEEQAAKGSLYSLPEPQATWLLYPARCGSVRFRPELHPGAVEEEAGQTAVVLLQPVVEAQIIDPLLRTLASDLDHEGWARLDDLKRRFAHLPLPTFQVWRSLSRHPDALAAVLLRLPVDEPFCERIHDELAVLWECIPVDVWVKAFGRFRSWAQAQGFPPALLASLLSSRQRMLRAVVPGLDFIADSLGSAQKGTLKKPPIELVLPYHYQELRRTHQANARWPTELAAPLAAWLERQRLPRSIRKLSNTTYSDAVTYLPIFMAHVTAGKAPLSALPGDPAHVKLVIRKISEFDRGWYLYVHSLLVSYLMAADT